MFDQSLITNSTETTQETPEGSFNQSLVPTVQAGTYTEAQLDTTGSILALADIYSGSDSTILDFETLKDDYTARVQFGREDEARNEIRKNIESRERDVDAAAIDELTVEAMQSPIEQNAIEIGKTMQAYYKDAQARQQAKRVNLAEEAAVKQLFDMAATDPVMAQIQLQNMREGDSLELIERNITKNVIIQRELSKLEAQAGEQSFLYTLLGSFSPTGMFAARANDPEEEKWFNQAADLMAQRDALMDPNLSVEEFSENLNQWVTNTRDAVTNLGLPTNAVKLEQTFKDMLNIAEDTAGSYNFWDNFEQATYVPVALSTARLLKATGNRKMLGNLAAVKLLTGQGKALNEYEAAVEALPKILKGSTDNASIGVAGDINNQTSRMARLSKELEEIHAPNILEEEELIDAIAAKREELSNIYKDQPVVDIKENIKQGSLVDSVSQVELIIGKRGGGGYSSESSARAALARKKILGAEVVKDTDSNQWFISSRHDIDTADFIKPINISDIRLSDTLGPLTQYIKSGANISADVISSKATVARAGTDALVRNIIKPRIDTVSKLSNREGKELNAVLLKGQQEEKWFTDFELDEMGLNPKQKKAYAGLVEANDIEKLIRDETVFKERHLQGWKQVEINQSDILEYNGAGRVIDHSDQVKLSNKRIYDTVKKAWVKTNHADFVEYMNNNKNFELLELADAASLPNTKDPVKFLIIDKGFANVRDLSRIQSGYVGGGHRVYRDGYFIKQANIGQYSDNGGRYIKTPLTHRTAATKLEAQEYVDRMNEALDAYKANKAGKLSDIDANEIITRVAGTSLDEWAEAVAKGDISEEVFEVVFDRELPKVMQDTIDRGGSDILFDEAQSSVTQWMNTNRQGFTSTRGEHLLHVSGKPAEILSPLEAMEEGINNAIRAGVWGDFKRSSIQRWNKAAKESGLISERELPTGISPMEFFNNAKIIHTKDPAAATKLEAQRKTINRMLSVKTEKARKYEKYVRNLAESVEGKPLGSFTSKAINNIGSSNPLAALRTFAFDVKLGLFNTQQVFLQIQSSMAAATIDPVNAPRALGTLPAARVILAGASDETIRFMAMNSKWKALHGMEPEEFLTYAKELKNSGHGVVSGSMVQIDDINERLETGGKALIKRAREGARMFLNEAETINRLFAHRMAYDRVKARGINPASDKGRQAIGEEIRELTFNMTSEGVAWFNKGALSIPTQFLSHQVRLMEAIFNGKKFTPAERLRLAVGQGIMYGASSTALVNLATEWYFNKYQTELTPTQQKFLTNGLWDGLLFWASDGKVDTNFGSRAGIGDGWEDLFRKLTGQDGVTSFLEVLGGPSYSVAMGAATGFVDGIINLGRAEQGLVPSLFSPEMARSLTSEISSMNMATKAYFMWKHGQVLSKTTMEPIAKSNAWEALALVIGLPPQSESDYYDLVKSYYNKQESIKDLARVPVRLRNEILLNWDDKEKVERNRKIISGYMQHFKDDPHVLDAILREVDRQTGREKILDAYDRSIKAYGESGLTDRIINKQIKENE